MTDPLRRVVGAAWYQSKYSRRGHGFRVLTLECGHTSVRKGSQQVPDRARCRQCEPGTTPRS